MTLNLLGSLHIGGEGFSVAKEQCYRRILSGYPATLYNTLNVLPINISIYGSIGGVGDYDNIAQAYRIPVFAGCKLSNIFDGVWRRGSNADLNASNRLCNKNAVYVEAGKTYTVKHLSEVGFSTVMIGYSSRNSNGTYNNADLVWNGVQIGNRTYSFRASQNMFLAFNSLGSSATGDIKLNNNDIQIMIIEGGYTAEQMANAKIDENNNVVIPTKTCCLYSDLPVTQGDILRVDPQREQAYRGSTNISALQDWTQDFTLPEADMLILATDTYVEPYTMEIAYWSSQKNNVIT